MKWIIVIGFLTGQTQVATPPEPRLAVSQEMASQAACVAHLDAVVEEAKRRKKRVWVACFQRASP